MKQATIFLVLFAFVASVAAPLTAEAGCSYNGYVNSGGRCAKSWDKSYKKDWKYERYEDDDDDDYEYRYEYRFRSTSEAQLEAYIEYLQELLKQLQDRLDDDRSSSRDEEPDVETRSATDIDEDAATLRGRVDMNDFRNGEAFFVYGEDEGDIEDELDDADRYEDIDTQGDDVQKVRVDNDVDGNESFSKRVFDLDSDTEHFFAFCVAYEDEDDEQTLECGDVEEFETDR